MKLVLLVSVLIAGFITCYSECEENWVQFDDAWSYFNNTGIVTCNSECEENWVQFDDACFYFSNSGRSWLDAENHCKGFHAYLASVDSKQKFDWIENIFKVLGYMRHQPHWIGGSDYAIEGEWRWIKTGMGIKYFNWGPSEPSGNDLDGEDCLEITNFNGTYLMADNDCAHHRAYYVCEKPAVTATASSVIG